MSDWQTIDFFFDESLVEDPYPYFEALRAEGPVLALPHLGVVAVTGYDEIGEVYRALMGSHYPAMAVVEVKALIEDRAKVEIETTAVVPV